MHFIRIYVYILCIFSFLMPAILYTRHKRKRYHAVSERFTSHRNYSEMSSLLKRQGFEVREFPGESPLVLFGDIAVPGEKVLQDIAQGRTTSFTINKKLIWKPYGTPHLYYILDPKKKADKNMVVKGVKTWLDNTCLASTLMEATNCNREYDHAVVCVGAYGGCWMESLVGMHPGLPKKVSLDPQCQIGGVVHEMGHALGNYHTQSRHDRDSAIFILPENLAVDLKDGGNSSAMKQRWAHLECMKAGEFLDLPLPYDFMSVMHDDFKSLADTDRRAVFMTKDVHNMVMLMYTRDADYFQSPYDLYVVNKAYDCIATWTKACAANGKQTPKCKNLGYLGKGCKCLCPYGFKGATCETKAGPMFPILPKAHTLLEVKKSGSVKIPTDVMKKQPPEPSNDDFNKFAQYATILLRGANETHATVRIIVRIKELDYFMQNSDRMVDAGCGTGGLVTVWGRTAQKHLRTECVSTIINNEEEAEAPWWRSKTNEMDIIIRSFIGKRLGQSKYTIDVYEKMELIVAFNALADKHLILKDINPGIDSIDDDNSNSTNGKSTTTTSPVGEEGDAGAQKAAAGGKGTLIAIVVGGVVFLALVAAAAIYCCNSFKEDGMFEEEGESSTDESTSTFFSSTSTESEDETTDKKKGKTEQERKD